MNTSLIAACNRRSCLRVKLAKCCTALSESPMAILRVRLAKRCTALSERPMAFWAGHGAKAP